MLQARRDAGCTQFGRIRGFLEMSIFISRLVKSNMAEMGLSWRCHFSFTCNQFVNKR